MTTQKETDSNSAQYQKFKEAARELETDQSEERFDRILKKIANVSPGRKAPATRTHKKATPSSRTESGNGD